MAGALPRHVHLFLEKYGQPNRRMAEIARARAWDSVLEYAMGPFFSLPIVFKRTYLSPIHGQDVSVFYWTMLANGVTPDLALRVITTCSAYPDHINGWVLAGGSMLAPATGVEFQRITDQLNARYRGGQPVPRSVLPMPRHWLAHVMDPTPSKNWVDKPEP